MKPFPDNPTRDEITNAGVDFAHDPTTSSWLKEALITAFPRDPIDAANDAEVLAKFLALRAEAIVQANKDCKVDPLRLGTIRQERQG